VHNIVAKANVLPLATLLPPLRVHSPGGFVMVGQAVNYHENPEPYGQMGWLVKTNPYGCIASDLINREVSFTREKDKATENYVAYGFKLGKFEFERKKSK